MIIGAEVAMLIMGLYALIAGRLMTGKKAKHVVQGWPARLIGVICLLPIPLAFAVGTAVAAILVALGRTVTRESFFWVGTAIEGSIVLACVVAVAILSRVYRTPVGPPQPDGADPGAAPDRGRM
jgi:hypothetical protein